MKGVGPDYIMPGEAYTREVSLLRRTRIGQGTRSPQRRSDDEEIIEFTISPDEGVTFSTSNPTVWEIVAMIVVLLFTALFAWMMTRKRRPRRPRR